MALRYPILMFLCIVLVVLYLYFVKPKKSRRQASSKIANTSFLKNTEYYQKLYKDYRLYKTVLSVCFILALICSIVLVGRLSKVDVSSSEEYKRDIFLCLDVSASVDELNIQLVENLKDTVKALKGERFGISIFNTTSVLVAPLTDDYDFILGALDEIATSIKANNSTKYGTYKGSDYFYVTGYIYSGTIEGNEIRGSSLIGDGLASCVYSFSNLEEDRSRTIIFSTDNELEGTPLVTLPRAAEISRKKNIKVFGIGTAEIKDKNRREFKSAMELTGGKYYDQSNSTVKSIVSDIEKTSKSLVKGNRQVSQQDIPTIPFLGLFFSLGAIFILSKKVIK